MKRSLFSMFILFSLGISAQEINGGPVNTPSNGVIDGIYVQEHIPTKRLIPYEFVREADVMFQKRVWRTIDLREKINHPLYFPHDDYSPSGEWVRHTNRWALWTVLKHHILKGEIVMYENVNPNYVIGQPDGDLFKYPIDKPAPGKNFTTDPVFAKNAISKLAGIKKKYKEDGITPEVKLDPVTGEELTQINPATGAPEPIPADPDTVWIRSKDIVEYRLKEDWFFDKERSQFDCRILGLAPVVYYDDKSNFVSIDDADNGKLITKKDILFWLYFPHIRFVLVNYNVYNQKNDANWMSFDDLFQKRMFSSTIYKQSNIFDRSLDTYKSGVEALYESQRITEELRNFEHDLWHF
jgi:gliding motility associated protien GldN